MIRAELRLIVLAGALMSAAALAEAAYKWVDEDGVTHFTQTPPAHTPAERVKPPPPPPTGAEAARETLQRQNQALEKNREERLAREKQARETAVAAQQRRDHCTRARGNLSRLQQHPRFRVMDAEGNVTVWTEEQRQQELSRARLQVDEFCD